VLKLKEIRKKKKMSQNEIAKLIGISPRTYLSIENGDSTPSYSTIKKISDALNISLDELSESTKQTYDDLPIVDADLGYPSRVGVKQVADKAPARAGGKETILVDAVANAGVALPGGTDVTHSGRPVWVPGLQTEGTVMIPVHGDSMIGDMSHGDHVICQRLDTAPSRYYNAITVVVDRFGSVLVKRLSVDENGSYLLSSNNTNHQPITITPDDIAQLWKVTHILKQVVS
jgi:transcriptional regulator with XRE-family HTH domain